MDAVFRESEVLLEQARARRQQLQQIRDRENVLLGMLLANPKLAKDIAADEHGITDATMEIVSAIAKKDRVAVGAFLYSVGVVLKPDTTSVDSMKESLRQHAKAERVRQMAKEVLDLSATYCPQAQAEKLQQILEKMAEVKNAGAESRVET